jgi:hypothetical protein
MVCWQINTGNWTHSKDQSPDSPEKQNDHTRSTETRSRNVALVTA